MNRELARSLLRRIGLGLSICSCLILAGISGSSPAEELPAPRQSPNTDITPRGERAPTPLKNSGWQKRCFKPLASMVCRTTDALTWDTGQVAVRVDLIESPGGEARLQVFLPVGLYLPSGVKLTIDQGAPVQLPYSWCLANTCVAATLADAKLIGALETGKTLSLEVVDSNILTVNTSLPLDRFATARKGAPEQVLEHQFDND